MSNICQSVNMADDAAARREARRKRILENSHNRLQLIAGKNCDELPKESTNKSLNSPIPQSYEPPILADGSVSSDYSLLNGILADLNPVVETTESSSSHEIAAGDSEIVNDFAAFIPSSPPEQPRISLWKTLVICKYDIVLLSLLLQFIYGLASVPFHNTYFFLPLIIYSGTKLSWFPKQGNSNITNVLLLLNGLSQSRLHNMIGILQWTSNISQDVCIYLFTTICIQSVLTRLRESFVT